jgi:glycerol-3-phosphate dehydrogenase
VSDANTKLSEIDIIISIIPCQFVGWAFSWMKEYLKDGVTILNLSKWIDNQSLQTISEKLSEVLSWTKYSYAYLAWGMIAAELVDWKKLWADIVTQNPEGWNIIQSLFQSHSLNINLKIWDTKNTELYAALKNIVALILGYYEWNWAWASTLWYYFSTLLWEMKNVIELLEWDSNLEFTDYALSWDLIATCFWASRNRLLGNLLWEWKDFSTALLELKSQNKIAEWYETLKWVYKLTQWKKWFEEINNFGNEYL